MEKTYHFYSELGFEPTKEYDPDSTEFNTTSGVKLQFYPFNVLADDICGDDYKVAGCGFNGLIYEYNTQTAEEVDRIAEIVKKAGGTIQKGPRLLSWGGYHVYFTDPDGYAWEATYASGNKFDERGMLI